MKIFSARTTDGNGSEFDWPGGQGALIVTGTPGGATVKLQMSPDGGTNYVDTEGSLANVTGVDLFTLPPCKVRGNVSSASGSTNIDAFAQKITPSVR